MREALLGETRWERWAVGALAAASIGLLAALPAWRMSEGPPGLYAEDPEDFRARVARFANAHATDDEIEGLRVVAPPPGDVPVLAQRFRFDPALRLKVGQTYRLHVASVDTVHSMAIEGTELFLIPGEVRVLTLTPGKPGRMRVQCNEYCGLGHNKMNGWIEVVP